MDKPIKSSEWRNSHWDLLQQNEWGVGDVLEDVEPDRNGNHFRCKIVRIESWVGQPLDANGRIVMPEQPSIHGSDGRGRDVIVRCEWPVGGSVHVTSLNCRDWRKVDVRAGRKRETVPA